MADLPTSGYNSSYVDRNLSFTVFIKEVKYPWKMFRNPSRIQKGVSRPLSDILIFAEKYLVPLIFYCTPTVLMCA